MNEEVYETVVKYLKTKDNNWKMIIGFQTFTAEQLIKKMKNDKKFREFITREIIKTAVDLFSPK